MAKSTPNIALIKISKEKADLKIPSQETESHKENAEIYHGEDLCKQKLHELLESFSLPNGLFPVEIMELGYNQSSQFIWLKQRHKTVYKHLLINKIVTFEAETAFVE
ncbi:conserved hypothetical protein [Ricinus communis]|uniref:Uncharacterized protein n=1 Tax=Ricinus communis TaxID=3988 RepID=B9S128_RICCO|nr:conserved hypothetical protein [Ricinus communis]